MLQEKIKIDKKDNYISLSKKLCNLGSKLILRSLKLIEQNNYKFVEQLPHRPCISKTGL